MNENGCFTFPLVENDNYAQMTCYLKRLNVSADRIDILVERMRSKKSNKLALSLIHLYEIDCHLTTTGMSRIQDRKSFFQWPVSESFPRFRSRAEIEANARCPRTVVDIGSPNLKLPSILSPLPELIKPHKRSVNRLSAEARASAQDERDKNALSTEDWAELLIESQNRTKELEAKLANIRIEESTEQMRLSFSLLTTDERFAKEIKQYTGMIVLLTTF